MSRSNRRVRGAAALGAAAAVVVAARAPWVLAALAGYAAACALIYRAAYRATLVYLAAHAHEIRRVPRPVRRSRRAALLGALRRRFAGVLGGARLIVRLCRRSWWTRSGARA